MEQLVMQKIDLTIEKSNLEKGYFIRCLDINNLDCDGIDWCKCCIDGELGLTEISVEEFKKIMLNDDKVKKDRIYMLISPSNEVVGTVTYKDGDTDEEAFIHMVGIRKDFCGKHLSKSMLSFALNKMKQNGIKKAILTTDDWRLPAIKTYINVGFLPVITDSETKLRWETVFGKLNLRINL